MAKQAIFALFVFNNTSSRFVCAIKVNYVVKKIVILTLFCVGAWNDGSSGSVPKEMTSYVKREEDK